jgi:hypothetical protein
MFYNYIVSVFVQEMIRLVSYLENKIKIKGMYSSKCTDKNAKIAYFSCIMLYGKRSARKLWFAKSFVIPEFLIQLLRK